MPSMIARAAGSGESSGAIGAAFGIGLPRFALRQGSLHAAWGPSWIRPPGPGEPVLTFVRRRSAG
ncbi:MULTISPECIES: hypothetical protein [unclassified Streptomyces]|uniref:hypothetical protein n=1 Tax=unclassified Streptomyces TaxID=2593676 RepID=UPI00114CC34B|nr:MULTISPECIES: hypothetical protein [unclassified Streptomyces]MYQ54317.1 hypothetical protein [Streptomyces sp. SID4941]